MENSEIITKTKKKRKLSQCSHCGSLEHTKRNWKSIESQNFQDKVRNSARIEEVLRRDKDVKLVSSEVSRGPTPSEQDFDAFDEDDNEDGASQDSSVLLFFCCFDQNWWYWLVASDVYTVYKMQNMDPENFLTHAYA